MNDHPQDHHEIVHLDFERHTLQNGLRVVLHHDPALPLVAVNLWYHVGSKNESPGRTGFAHLFEHLLFQGSEHVGTNDHFRYVQEAGGVSNGSTWFDRTTYYEVLPAHQLDLGLWLEADRMGFFLPAITQEKLDNQREVVINERRQRIDNQPYGRAFERLQELLYPADHGYHWPVIGYIEDLEQANLDDVNAFFRAFYGPNNAVLTLAGDFDDDALARVERYFGDVPPGPEVVQPEFPAPGAAPGERRETLYDQVDLARIYVGHSLPAYGTRSWYAADLLAGVLADGKASPLYRDLVYERELAQDVSCYILPTEAAATFMMTATAVDGADPGALEEALVGHLERAAREAPAADDLERARNRLLMSTVHGLQTLDRRADMLSHCATFFDDPGRAGEETRIYREIEPAELSTVVRDYARPEQRVVITVLPESQRPAARQGGEA